MLYLSWFNFVKLLYINLEKSYEIFKLFSNYFQNISNYFKLFRIISNIDNKKERIFNSLL